MKNRLMNQQIQPHQRKQRALLGLSLLGLFVLFVACSTTTVDAATMTVKQLDGKIRVECDGKLFTDYIYKGVNKPILYPILGPHDIGMTRNYPMKPGVKGEAEDHPHHESMWFTHGSVNGIDFWAKTDTSGLIVQDKILKSSGGSERAVIETANRWQTREGKTVCTDIRTLTFFTIPQGRIIDWRITIFACNGDVTFGDTKEGTMGIRTTPSLRLKNDLKRGVTTANGHAVNSKGDKDADVWGKRADWIDYWGLVDGKMVGISIFDHPDNPRHPTWWHARTYGLVTANPFGIHNFENKPEGVGNLTIPAGKSLTFRYRFLFHKGDTKQAKIEELYKQYSR